MHIIAVPGHGYGGSLVSPLRKEKKKKTPAWPGWWAILSGSTGNHICSNEDVKWQLTIRMDVLHFLLSTLLSVSFSPSNQTSQRRFTRGVICWHSVSFFPLGAQRGKQRICRQEPLLRGWHVEANIYSSYPFQRFPPKDTPLIIYWFLIDILHIEYNSAQTLTFCIPRPSDPYIY